MLPKDKFDFETVIKINKLEKRQVIPLLPRLLEWVQDMNWPIAPAVVQILCKYPKEMVVPLKEVFASDDDIWKYWCLEYLVKQFPLELFKDELTRLATMPTGGEKLEEVDELAKEILKLTIT